MLQKSRQRKKFKKKIIAYIFLLILLGAIIFLINSVFISKKALFISPLGNSNADSSLVEKLLKKNNILFSSILLSGNSYIIGIPSNGEVRFSSQKDIGKQVSSLQRILRELTIEGKPFKSIDFRFSDPIISF